jgi:flagellar biosynthetic protein FlhB
MADHDQEQNRSEQATPFKLKEARDRGMVAKSAELNSFVVTLAFVALLYGYGRGMLERLLRLDAGLLSQAHRLDFSEAALGTWLPAALLDTLGLLLPVFGVLVAAGVIASLAQTGPVFTFEPLKPDLDRVNPVAGLKRLFSMRLVFESAKNLVKLALLGYALFSHNQGLVPLVLGLAQADPHAFARIGVEAVGAMTLKLALVMLAVALLDAGYVHWDYAKRMMMSRREMKEEHKRREGDPKIKARIRELQAEMRKRSRALKRVSEADVLITNPTHLAVALAYRRESMAAPQVIAKGAGELAQKMKALARRHGVAVAENRPLARALFLEAALDSAIPRERYAATARVLAWAYALREARDVARGAVPAGAA